MGILDYLLVSLISSGIKNSSHAAARNKEEKKLIKGAEEAGLSLYAYAKSQLSTSMQENFASRTGNPEKLKAYLDACKNERLLSDYRYEVLWEGYAGEVALQRLQERMGQNWNPHDILEGFVSERILNQCDQDKDSYGLQIVYLDQQVVQENISRTMADLVLNIYKLARGS